MDSYVTLRDIKSTPEGLRSLLRTLFKYLKGLKDLTRGSVERVVLVGSGTSYYAALASSYAFNGLSTYVSPSSELYLYPPPLEEGDLAIMFSRSGETTEVLRALDYVKGRGCKVIALTHNPNSPLSLKSDFTVPVEVGEEGSILMTKTFSGLTLTGIAIGWSLTGEERKLRELNKVPEAVEETLRKSEGEVKELAKSVVGEGKYVFCLGSGPSYPVAMEVALKFIEASETPAQGLHLMEFRHGFKVLAYNSRVFLIAPKGRALKEAVKLAWEIKGIGSKVTIVSNEEMEGFESLKIAWEGSEVLTPPIFTPPLQLLTYHLAVLKGLNPDKPRSLNRVVRL